MKPILPKGHTSCLSPTFKYTSSGSTDVRATFARVRARQTLPSLKEMFARKVVQFDKEKP